MDNEGHASNYSGRPHEDVPYGLRHASAFPQAEPSPLPSINNTSTTASATHSQRDSISATPAQSLENPLGSLNARAYLRRPRSKSALPSIATSFQAESRPTLADLWKQSGGPPVAKSSKPRNFEVEDDDEDEVSDDSEVGEGPNLIDIITPDMAGFQQHILKLNPALATTNNYLVDRIAHQQLLRYKQLLRLKVIHMGQGLNCQSGSLCIALGGSAKLLDQGGDIRELDPFSTVADDEDTTPTQGEITPDHFPQDIPMPPTSHLPAEFECQLCYRVKKFQKPSDWTKHVLEDVQPFTCTWDKCREPKMFKRKADWVRHENEAHRHLEWWTCDVEDCRHTCYRRDNFLQHLVREHKLPEPKVMNRVAIKRAQRAGILDSVWLKVESCHEQTPVHPREEACRFCGKSFPTWKKLTVHLAKHMEQISLPVLHLVAAKEKELSADTIISPVQDLPPRQFLPIQPPLPSVLSSSSNQDQFGIYQETYANSALYPTPYSSSQPTINVPQPTQAYYPLMQFPRAFGQHMSTDPQNVIFQDQIEPLPMYGVVTPTGAQAAEEALHFTANIATGPPTDSGYTSIAQTGHGKSENELVVNASQDEPGLTELEFDDTATEYSNASSVPTLKRDSYIWEFAEDLFNEIGQLRPDEENLERISAILPDLLKAFALRLGHNAPTQMHRDVMFFVHRYRSVIATSFKDKSIQQPESPPDAPAHDSERMPLKELMSSWFAKQDREEIRLEEPGGQHLNAEDTYDEEIHHRDSRTEASCESDQEAPEDKALHSDYGDFVLKSKAFQWLLASLRVELRLAPTEPRTMETIRQKIIHSLRPSQKVSRKTSAESFRCSFQINWDPLGFLEKQKYLDEPAEAVPKVITLTGSCQDAQALTCAQYLKQTWPLTGEAIMQVIKDVLGSGPNQRHTCELPDGTELCAGINGRDFLMRVSGIAASIAEVGEQLAWLGAALRASPLERGLVHCIPSIKLVPLSSPETTYMIEFTIEEAVQQTAGSSNGQCWHNMFLNPVIVKGYPIPPKTEPNSGLEIPLNMMAGLARTERVDRFDKKTFIKGFSTLLVPTKKIGDTLFWHLVYNEDGTRVSYLDNTVTHTEYVETLDLTKLRHVLGWCSEAKFFVGSAQVNHLVGNSGLPKPHKHCALANLFVSPGRYIAGGTAFGLGTKDTPTHVARNGYIPKLQWIATKFVLLWDEADKRGWLVNGTSALLYIVRASLELNSRDKFRAAFVFKKEHLQESPTPFAADSAIDVLINPENLALRLYHENDGFLLLRSRIEYFYGILEKLIDHQADIAGVDGVNLVSKPRQDLEGWDFKDLTTNRDPLYPRVAALEASGKGWVDFTRAIHAVTLFGRGFGELIKPVSADICDYWTELPKEKYYVAACLSDLLQMIENNDYHNDGLVRLSENTIWHTPGTIFGSCQCKGALGPDHCEPVQSLFPSAMLGMLLPRKVSIPQESRGAVIFGHNSAFSWVWGDHGQPMAGTPSSSKVSDVGSFNDSGLGPSQRSLRSESSAGISLSNAPGLVPSANPDDADVVLADSPSLISEETHDREDYTVGILCALPKELLAVRALFDKTHDSLGSDPGDSNRYALGQMKRHMVVAACLPDGEYGTNPAADSASNMKRSFPNMKFCLLVGIGGGAPTLENDIRLGDVVVSSPRGNHPGVIQYDRGKEIENSTFELTGALQPPPRFLMTAISSLTSNPDLPSNPLEPYLKEMAERIRLPQRLKYTHPGQEHDEFFRIACSECQARTPCADRDSHMQKRNRRPTDEPEIHYGLIASGNRVIKDAQVRDQWARRHGVLCFEMEAAGIMNILPCLVIRGICDYADSYKNKVWQEYAAATAAAYAKLLLGVVAPFESQHGYSAGWRGQTPRDEDRGESSRSRKRRRGWSDLY